MFDFFVFIGVGALVLSINSIFLVINFKSNEDDGSGISAALWFFLTIFIETIMIFRMLH